MKASPTKTTKSNGEQRKMGHRIDDTTTIATKQQSNINNLTQPVLRMRHDSYQSERRQQHQ